jgi:hypothetical protein
MKVLDRVLHLVIILQNCGILYDMFFRHQDISWWKVGFLSGSVLLLVIVWLFPRVSSETVPTASVVSSDQVEKQVTREFATQRLNELFLRGQFLASNAPKKEDSGNFARFWSEEVNNWMTVAGMLIEKNWGADDKRFFLSLVGENPIQFAIGLHNDCARLYNDLLRYLKNLDTLKQQLSRHT